MRTPGISTNDVLNQSGGGGNNINTFLSGTAINVIGQPRDE